MPKIKGSEWYTAAALKGKSIEGSERCTIGITYGYRRSLAGLPEKEIQAQQKVLSEYGIISKIKVSSNNHTDIPAGTPFLEVMDEKSVARLEHALSQKGIELPADRFDIYTKQTPKRKLILPSNRSY